MRQEQQRNNSPLAELMALVQMSTALNEPVQRQSQVDMQTALQLLGLQQEASANQARNELSLKGLDYEGQRIGLQQQELEANAAREARLGQDSQFALLSSLLNDPGMAYSDKMEMAKVAPLLAPKIEGLQNQAMQRNVAQKTREVQGIYNTQKNPKKIQEVLNVLFPDWTDPAAQQVPWAQLNAAKWPK
jgi:hypothetical protein